MGVETSPVSGTPLEPLDEYDARFRVIADTLPAYIAYIDDQMRYAMVNQTYLNVFGKTSEEVIGQSVISTLGDSYEFVRGHLEAALAGEPQLFESRMNTVEGERFLMVRQIPDRAKDGSVRGIIVHGVDITDRRRAELALQASEERLRLALSAANGIGTWDWDVPNDIVKADATFARFYGVAEDRAAAGVPIAEFTRGIHPEDFGRAQAAIQQALASGGDYTSEYRLIQPDGTHRWFNAHGRCALAPDGSPLRFPGVAIDITDRKQSEEALVRTEKLAAVGRLASSIAHEINNPLESVVNLLYLIEATVLLDAEEAQKYARIAQQEIGRVSQIATQTLRFFKQSTGASNAQIDDLLGSVLALYQGRLANSNIAVVHEIPPGIAVRCFEGEIRQVLNNLVGNAIDAMRQGGRLVVRARWARGVSSEVSSGRPGVRITICDNGEGMSRKTVQRIFEPFFTTKGIMGTGLGLWVTLGIVQKHEGRLQVRSSQGETGHGTVFSLFLPEIKE